MILSFIFSILSLPLPNQAFAQDPILESEVASMRTFFRKPTLPKPDPQWAALGKQLFHDPLLSGNQKVSCASCHSESHGWSDGRPRAEGWDGKTLGRRTPSLWNTALNFTFFWDGRARTLEEQALGPITSPHEMNLSEVELEQRLNANESYRFQFQTLIRSPNFTGVRARDVAFAIAEFERTLVASKAPFDSWLDGDVSAISDTAKRGLLIFRGKGQCLRCHSGWNFTDQGFHDIGIFIRNNSDSEPQDLGRFHVTGLERDKHRFKTPTLRNLLSQNFFMHDGSQKNLADVLAHYNRGGRRQGSELNVLGLSYPEERDLMGFLISLSEKPRAP